MTAFDEIVAMVAERSNLEADGYRTDDRTWVNGSIQQRDRIAAIADYAARRWAGDFIEIGCLHGGTTRRLASVARLHGRRIVCVDPWPSKCPIAGTDYGKDPFATFKAAMLDWWDLLDIIKASSMDAATIAAVKTRPLCFAFVDGLHTYEAAASDIATVAHCIGIIAVDDIGWEPGVARAFWEGAGNLSRDALHNKLNREGYIGPPRDGEPRRVVVERDL